MAIDDGGPIRAFRAQALLWGTWLGVVGAGAAAAWRPSAVRGSVWPAALVSLAALDALAAQRLPLTIEDRSPRAVEMWRQLDAEHDGRLDLTSGGGCRMAAVGDADAKWVSNKNLPVKTPVLRGYTPFSNRFHEAWARNPFLRGTATGIHGSGSPTRWGGGSVRCFVRCVLEPKQRSRISRVSTIESLPPARRISVSVKSYRPEELVFEVEAPSKGWLLVTDRWAAGWRAEVNGRGVAVAPADFIFRAVPVSAGTNRVRFEYRPFGVPWLVVLSWAAVALVGTWTAAAARRSHE